MITLRQFPDMRYSGRLGNNLYELAALIGLADSMGEKVILPTGWIYQPYFNLPDDMFGEVPPDAREATDWAGHIEGRVRIFLQDINFFKDSLPKIREYFKPSALAQPYVDKCSEFWELPRPVLSIHVRRGDLTDDPVMPDKTLYYTVPKEDFYRRAINQLKPGMASVAIFSDGIDWCKERFDADYFHEGTPYRHLTDPDFMIATPYDWIDLHLMAACERHLVGGSTFGIWGALMADDKEALYQRPVYGPAYSFIDESLLFLPSWKALDV